MNAPRYVIRTKKLAYVSECFDVGCPLQTHVPEHLVPSWQYFVRGCRTFRRWNQMERVSHWWQGLKPLSSSCFLATSLHLNAREPPAVMLSVP